MYVQNMDTLHTTIVESRANLAKLRKKQLFGRSDRARKKPRGVFSEYYRKGPKVAIVPSKVQFRYRILTKG